MDKEKIVAHCVSLLHEKIATFQNALRELSEGAANEGKSSAGDKHETARAMAQLEQEKLGKQLQETEQQLLSLEKNNGRLFDTDRGVIFVSVALGKITVEGKPVMVISVQSPLGQKLSGVEAGSSVVVNGTAYGVRSVV